MRVSFFRKYGDKLLFVLALAILAAVLFRQGGKKAITIAAAPSIVFTHWWEDDLGKDTLEELAAEFENRHEGIKIVLNPKSYEDLRKELFDSGKDLTNENSPAGLSNKSVETGGDDSFPGDVIALDPLWVPGLLKRNIIEKRPAGTEDGDAPILSFIDVLYYNIDILREAGFSRPPKTRSEFLECLKAAASVGDITGAEKETPCPGLVMDFDSSRLIYDDIFPWIWAAGARFTGEEKPAFNTAPVIETLSFLDTLNREKLIVSAGGNKMEQFISGGAVFMIAPSGAVKRLRSRMGDEVFGVSSVPVPDNYPGKSAYGTAAWTTGVNSTSKFREEAGLFAAFLKEKTAVLSEKAGAVPEGGTPEYAEDPFSPKIWDIFIAGESARDFPGPGVEEIINDELRALFAGNSTPPETAAAVQRRWEALSEENFR